MSCTTHDQLIDSLAELRRAMPTMRLGQLIANMATVARGAIPGAIWDAEDDELLGAIRWQLEQLAAAAGPDATPDRGGTNGHPGTSPQPPRPVN